MAQRQTRPAQNRELVGSNPTGSTTSTPRLARFARKGSSLSASMLGAKAFAIPGEEAKCGERGSDGSRVEPLIPSRLVAGIRSPTRILREGRRSRLACLISMQAPCDSESRYQTPDYFNSRMPRSHRGGGGATPSSGTKIRGCGAIRQTHPPEARGLGGSNPLSRTTSTRPAPPASLSASNSIRA